MQYMLKYENKLKRKGFTRIAGLDEAGRGSWAGPIMAAAVIFPKGTRISGLKDSKKLSARLREELYGEIIDKALAWSVGMVSHKLIDRWGIGWANNQVFLQAIKKLDKTPDFLLVDYFRLKNVDIPFEPVISGDNKVRSIAAASIIAKVTRDNYLKKLDKKYPQYGFARHKGYGTKLHYEMICKHGLCEVHRQSFRPMNSMVNAK